MSVSIATLSGTSSEVNMRRLTVAGALLSTALVSGLVFATASPSAVAAPQIRQNYEWVFGGATYPDTSAGHSACQAQGESDVAHFPLQFESWECQLNDPDAGVYNLWVLENEEYL
jgi:hypothetical protein